MGHPGIRWLWSEPQVPPLRSPEFPVETGGVGKLHAAFFTESRTRGHVQRCVAGNPGTLQFGMTILLQGNGPKSGQTNGC